MKIHRCIIPALFVLALMLKSCEPIEKLGVIPEIHYKSYTPVIVVTDTTANIINAGGELVFSFADGDADFGMDTSYSRIDTANIFLVPFIKTEEGYDPMDAEIYGRTYKILHDEKMDRTGGNTTVKGDIKITITYLLPPPVDTLKFDFYIVDRAGHISNVESTRDIALSEMTLSNR
jgi:hypothetical protein